MSDEDKHPHPLEALRAYVEGLEAQEHDYRARGDDASRRLLSNQAHAARHALALATEALDAAERDAVALATRIESYVHIRERDGDSGTTRRAIADMGRMAGEMLTKYPEAKQ